MLLRETSFVIVDVETTGLNAARDRITEIAMVRFEHTPLSPPIQGMGWGMVDSYTTLVNPEQYIPPFITQHTGITNAMVYGKPKFREVLPEIKQFLSKSDTFVFTGHNVNFDHGFVRQSFERQNESFLVSSAAGLDHLLCTCKLARRMLPTLRHRSLKHVQDHFGIKNPRQHRAMGDAQATAQILGHFLEMLQEMEIDTLAELLRFQNAKSNNGRRKTKREVSLRETVKSFPERPGVYTMTNSSGDILYVGKAKNLRDRVASYFSDANTRGTKLAQMMRAVKDITYEEAGSELSALLLESRRIKELAPRFNSLERSYKSQAFLKLDIQNPFPKLSMTREPGQDGAEYYGPFRSRKSVEALIDVLNRSFMLRECKDNFVIGLEVKPCFYYEIHRCNAPCAMIETKEKYREEVERLRRFLATGEDGVLALVERMMYDAAGQLDFEEAQFLKIRLLELRRVLGRGERSFASLNANDFVILNRATDGQCEVLFIRFGLLAKQIVLGPAHLEIAEEWFYRQMRLYYGATAATPPACGKPEIDEMRILSRWAEQSRKKGSTIVYLGASWEDSVVKLVRELREILGPT
jgi:DNA polymerase-3 subunit epsilon